MRFTKIFLNLLILTLLFSLASCVDEEPLDPAEIDADIELMVNKVHQGFFEFEINGGTKEESISLPSEGMDGIYGIRSADLDNLEGDDLTLFDCVNTLNPGIVQKVKLRDVSNTFAVCRFSIGIAYKDDIASLLEKTELERQEIIGQFEVGESTEQQMNEKLLDLRNKFRSSYLEIKEFYSEFFRTCTNTLITEIQTILSNQQWTIFVNCILG
jgi:hypothetical protein